MRERGPIRRAFLPAEPEPVFFGTHDEVREHYGTAPGQYADHATTLDYCPVAKSIEKAIEITTELKFE